jgi:GT2 family glycosyltransferase
MGTPPVSVLLPVRDGAPHLDECIASLAAQTEGDFEVIAVDDGSRDRTSELLADWATRDRRVRVHTQRPLGLVAALERARAHARGRWLARMDADDVALPNRLAAQRALMEADPTLSACGGGVRYVPRDAVRGGALRYERWLNALTTPEAIARDLFVECPLAHPTFFMRADAVAAVGGYRDRGWPEDYDLLLRLWRAGGRMTSVPEVVLHWREGAGRLSRVHPAYGADAFRRCKAHHLAASLLAGRDAVVWGAGPTGKAFARALAREGVRTRAFVDLDPRKIGQVIQDAPVLAPADLKREPGVFCVAAVGQPGAREEIRATLRAGGWREGADCAAVA